MRTVARAVDGALEASVVGSFSKVGFLARRRLFKFSDPGRLEGAVAVVTGATSGIGLEVAGQFAGLGATTYLWGRDADRVERARQAVLARAPGSEVRTLVADLGDPDSVRAACDRLATEVERIDTLVHNAGAITPSYTRSGFGVESTVATQLLAPFLITTRLLPQLRAAAPGRVITVSSGGMYSQRFDLGRLEMGEADYDGVTAYARVKRAQVVMTHEWSRHVEPAEVVFHVMHPGWADTPGVADSLPRFHRLMAPLLRDPAQGADTIVWLATSPEARGSTGRLWLDRRPRSEYRMPGTRPVDALDDGRRLWQWCEERLAQTPQ